MSDSPELSVEGIFKAPPAPQAPEGWVALTADFFSAIPSDDNLTNFFNGGEPYWGAVVNSLLPRIQLTESLLERTRRRLQEKKTGIELLIGPTGEGKSTALRQAAVALAQKDARTILWREQHDAVLERGVIEAAQSYGAGTVLVSDNAHVLLEQLHQLIKAGKFPLSDGLQLLLASRDTDWTRRVRELGFVLNPAEAWKSMGPIVATKHPFGRVSETDAKKIIRGWRALEPHEPEAIRGVTESEAASLLSEASVGADPQHGALLGGLLALRYTPEELRSHLVSLLESLAGDVTPAHVTLADLVVALSLVDVAGIDGLASEVIAAFCGVEESDLRSQVANRLGQEAVANYSDDTMRSRHPKISETTLEIAMSDGSAIAAEAAAVRLLTIVDKIGGLPFRKGYGELFGLGRKLHKAKVPVSLSRRSRQLGIALAKKACQLRPNNLANHMALSECLRSEQQAQRAVETVWTPIAGRLGARDGWQDWNKNSRTAVNEFAIAMSLAGDEVAAAALRFAALSDKYESFAPEVRRAAICLAGLSIHLSRLFVSRKEPWLAESVAEIHGCIVACFADHAVYLDIASESLDAVGRASVSFTTPGEFLMHLNDVMRRISSFGSDHLEPALWVSRSRFTELGRLLTRMSGIGDA